MVKDGPAEALRRTWAFPGQTPLYSTVAWAAVALGGPSEIAVPLPSLLSAAAAAWALWSLARGLLGRGVAGIATLLFVSHHAVAFAAADGRPYALGLLLAMLATSVLPTRSFGVVELVVVRRRAPAAGQQEPRERATNTTATPSS